MSDVADPPCAAPLHEARAIVDRWLVELGSKPAETRAKFRFVVSMGAVKVGELWHMVRDGKPVVILVDPYSERFFQGADPQLGEAEPEIVDAMLRILGGL